jgi:hypothetical protein
MIVRTNPAKDRTHELENSGFRVHPFAEARKVIEPPDRGPRSGLICVNPET